MNPVAEALTGWPHGEARGRPLREVFRIVNEETREVVENPVARVLDSGGVVGLANHTLLLSRDGREVPIDDCAAPIRGDQEACTGVVLVFHDVTERRRLEQKIAQAQRMEAVGRLAGGVAHDFNNMLTAILGYTELLLRNLLPGHPMREELDEIKKAASRAAALTHQLLAFGRKRVLQPTVLDLNQVVAGTAKMLRRVIPEDIKLETILEPQLQPVRADRGHVEQAIVNLVLNARDAMPRGGTLVIGTANVVLTEADVRDKPDLRPGPYVELLVRDTGCGMDEATLARMFEPFFTTKGPGKGTGLGLATVYGIVKQSGGDIGVASQVGRGTTVQVWFPAVEGTPAPVRPASAEPGLPRGQETVLLVEDDDVVRGVALRALRDGGYTVVEARHAEEALAVSRKHPGPIHLLLTDIVMPGMDGMELARRCRVERPQCRVLFMSGYSDKGPSSADFAGGETVVLRKPFAPLELLQRVRDRLNTAG
jgi:PAS domain S-box-containing protein